ncbi:poly(R)-hydroxyalkanoic acid synthase subunit PhaE [Halobium salinum]|uniref:Poly(3-hydroxyalkanoate) polymerase subunit PhaE n=1 Tax=Halobium salinum TaxID=1364940 RepID=A0ABD5PAW6_9EURY|nr:poly(R)-hydroxyalkanoic acid synthase subunit PhaE [Halobium salinum]
MSEQNYDASPGDQWSSFVEESNRAFADAFERNVEAQSRFVDAWLDAVEESTENTSEMTEEGLDGYAKAYEVWMTASEDVLERVADAFEGEEVAVEDFRDIWLNAANESFKEVMSTSAFAAMTGQRLEETLQLQQELDESAEATLHTLGFATEGDVQEVGKRLVELERRQHAIESKLDRVIDAMED